MKNLFILLMLALSLASCDKDLLDVDFSTELSQTSDEIVVNETLLHNKITGSTYETEFDLDLSNPDTQKYLDRIKEVETKDVKMAYIGLQSLAGNTQNYFLEITLNNQFRYEISGFNFDQVAGGNPLSINNAGLMEKLSSELENQKKVHIKISGNIPSGQLYRFKIQFSAKVNITAKAL